MSFPNGLSRVWEGSFRIFKLNPRFGKLIASCLHIKSELCSLPVEFNAVKNVPEKR